MYTYLFYFFFFSQKKKKNKKKAPSWQKYKKKHDLLLIQNFICLFTDTRVKNIHIH